MSILLDKFYLCFVLQYSTNLLNYYLRKDNVIVMSGKGEYIMDKMDLIRNYLDNEELPPLAKERDYTIQEYMKLKKDSLYKIAEAIKKP